MKKVIFLQSCNFSELFTTVLDMLAALIHTTQVSDTSNSDRGEENRKQYLNLVKKLKVRYILFYFIFLNISDAEIFSDWATPWYFFFYLHFEMIL